jgi:hypothetical protein
MTTWTNISNAAVAVGAIPSSTTVTALRDNPVAIAGAASGAPVVFAGWHPYDKVSVGDGKDGLIYDHAVNGTVAEVITPTFEEGFEYRLIGSGLSHNSGSSRLFNLEANRQTSGYQFAYFSTSSYAAAATIHFDAEIILPRLIRPNHIWRVLVSSSGTLDVSRECEFSSSSQKITDVKVLFSAGSIDAGKIWMFRRREYASSP